MENESYDVLVVEDNPATVNLLQTAWEDADVAAEAHVVTSGSAAFEFLHGQSDPAGAHPDVILLDLGLGARSGLDVLADIRAEDGLSSLPVIVFSGSEYGGTVESAYQAGANAYITKPDDYEEMVSAVTAICDFWLSVAELPFRRPSE